MIEFTEEPRSRSEIYAFMCSHGKGLRSDEHFNKLIRIIHLDGSEFHLCSCSWDEDDKRIYVWTEHCGYLYFYKEDIEEMEIKQAEWSEIDSEFKMVEHTFIKFNMEVKPNGSTETEETGVSD